MIVLRIEHAVPDWDAWKRAFDDDPLQRTASGVRAYRILRPADDPAFAIVDLEFEARAEAEAMAERLRGLWAGIDIVRRPMARVLEVVEQTRL